MPQHSLGLLRDDSSNNLIASPFLKCLEPLGASLPVGNRIYPLAPKAMKIRHFIILILGIAGHPLSHADGAPSPALRERIEADWSRQEQVIRGGDAATAKAVDGVLERGRLLCEDLDRCNRGDATAVRKDLDEVAAERARLGNAGTPEALRALYCRARWAMREAMLAHRRLAGDRLLFLKRQWPRVDHQCAHRVGEAQSPGANLCELTGLQAEGTVREILDSETARGGIGRPDLSFDAARIVFPYARPRNPPTNYPLADGHSAYDPEDPKDSTAYRGGSCHMYNIYTVGVDGRDLRRLTADDTAEDTEPCWLPDGRIAFTSSREGRMVQCGDWALVFGIWSMAADGSDLRKVGEPQDSEFYPSTLEDGRILYTRWDYVMKPYNVIQQLWTVYPDGRNAQLAFGDWYAFSRGPLALFEARQIPGARKAVAVGSAHHNTCAGSIMVVDLDKNRMGPSGMVNITPWIGYPEATAPLLDERIDRKVPEVPLISNHTSNTGWYASPYPLDDGYFLVSYSFEQPDNAAAGYGIYLIDRFGNQELIHRGQGYSCYAPMLLTPRKTPPVLPDQVHGVDPATPGRMLVLDVNEGLEGIPRGTAKFLRIIEISAKNRHTNPHRCDTGVSSGYDLRSVLGTVPVAEDGSTFFEVPSGKLLMLEALDENHLELQRMRNYVNLMPGETRSCIGCHEKPGHAPVQPLRSAKALVRGPVPITPPPWGAGPMGFKRVVQPLLDRQCIRCHDGGAGSDHASDLRGAKMVQAPTLYDRDEGPQHLVSDSFLALLPHVNYVKVGGYQGPKLPFKPGACGSRVSPLMRLLAKDHHALRLPAADWQALASWIDCNAPYFAVYEEMDQTPARGLEPSLKDIAAIAARSAQLRAEGRRLVAYLAGGLQSRSLGAGPVVLSQTDSGAAWTWPGANAIPDLPATQRQAAFAASRLGFTIDGLDLMRRYMLCVTWWDFDGNGRRQSVFTTGSRGRQQLARAQNLPSWRTNHEKPALVEAALPPESIVNGRARFQIVAEAPVNCVVSEAWVEER